MTRRHPAAARAARACGRRSARACASAGVCGAWRGGRLAAAPLRPRGSDGRAAPRVHKNQAHAVARARACGPSSRWCVGEARGDAIAVRILGFAGLDGGGNYAPGSHAGESRQRACARMVGMRVEAKSGCTDLHWLALTGAGSGAARGRRACQCAIRVTRACVTGCASRALCCARGRSLCPRFDGSEATLLRCQPTARTAATCCLVQLV